MSITFYTIHEPYGFFSNFSPHGFVLDGVWWPTSEHYFQAQKFAGTPYAELIRTVKKPKDAARLGRDRKHPIRSDWEQVKEQVMRMAVYHKFKNHAELQQLLLSTGDELIIENSPIDYYWGCGADGSGLNRLGEILMEVRSQLRQEKQEESYSTNY